MFNALDRADFVTHVGFSTVVLIVMGIASGLLLEVSSRNVVHEANVSCVFSKLESLGNNTMTVLQCGDQERNTIERPFAGWAWQNRDKVLRCDISSAGYVVNCVAEELAPST